jgi:hypothetical protein
MSNRLALTIDTATYRYIRIDILDASNTVIGYGEEIYPFHIKNVVCVEGKTIGIDKCGGPMTGLPTTYRYLIPYDDIIMYNGATPAPGLNVIITALRQCVRDAEGA